MDFLETFIDLLIAQTTFSGNLDSKDATRKFGREGTGAPCVHLLSIVGID